jgi:hypothetical protein
MRSTLLSSFVALCPALAVAAPLTIAHQGRLVGPSGAPLSGPHDVRVRLYDVSSAVVHDETFASVPFQDGYFSVVLGGGVALQPEDLANGPVLLGVAVDGGAELGVRQQLHAAPYAIEASSVVLGGHTACNPANNGRLRWTGSTIDVCNGSSWLIASRPGLPRSCQELYQSAPWTTSGTYTIDPNGGSTSDSFVAYCEMALAGGGWTRVAAMSSTFSVCGMVNAQGTSADVASGTAPSWLPAATVSTIPWNQEVLLVDGAVTNWVQWRSTNSAFTWQAIADGTIGTTNSASYGAQFRRHNESTFTAANGTTGCNKNGGDCLLGSYQGSSQWTMILGIGAYGRNSHAQDASCQSHADTSQHRGMYSGFYGSPESWARAGFVYVR